MAYRIPAVPSMLSCGSSGRLRAAMRLRSSQSFLPFSSRASYRWTQFVSTIQRPTLSKPNGKTSISLHKNRVFSTSAKRSIESQDGKGHISQGLSDHETHVRRSALVNCSNQLRSLCPCLLLCLSQDQKVIILASPASLSLTHLFFGRDGLALDFHLSNTDFTSPEQELVDNSEGRSYIEVLIETRHTSTTP